MSRLLLWDAVRAPLQEGEETCYSNVTRAVVVGGEIFYYRKSEYYADWIEVFTYQGESLGSFRTVSVFMSLIRSGVKEDELSRKRDEAKALEKLTRPLVGRRIVKVEIVDAPDVSFPFTVFMFEDGRQMTLQSDPEGNDGGFPNIAKPVR